MRWQAPRTGNARKLRHPWFAWRPVRVGHTWVWLEVVTRWWVRPENHMGRPRWEYALKARRPKSECDGTEYYR